MVREKAHYYTRAYRKHIKLLGGRPRPYEEIYEDMEAQGFLIYCWTIQKYYSEKASFSTYLYTCLSGYLCAYCKRKMRKEGLDSSLEDLFSVDSSDDNINFDMFSTRKYNTTKKEFLLFAKDYLSSDAYKVLSWILSRQWEDDKCKKLFNSDARLLFCGVQKWSGERLHTAWNEISDYWRSGLLMNVA